MSEVGPWTIKAVRRETRETVLRQARARGLTAAGWLAAAAL